MSAPRASCSTSLASSGVSARAAPPSPTTSRASGSTPATFADNRTPPPSTGSASIGSVNGTTPAARFYTPQNVALDSATNIYVADTQNSIIRKITPSGIVSTLAGTPGVFGSAERPGRPRDRLVVR